MTLGRQRTIDCGAFPHACENYGIDNAKISNTAEPAKAVNEWTVKAGP